MNNNFQNWGMSVLEAINFYQDLISKGIVKVPSPAYNRLLELKRARLKGIKNLKDVPKIPVG